MTIECAIKELKEDIDLYIPLHGTIDDVDRELPDGRLITALEMAIASLEAWDKAYNKFKELSTIKNFHGLQFKDKHLVSLEYVVEYMDECLNETEVWSGFNGKQIVAPKGTFDKIYNSPDEGDDI